jgi:hypothetical protein
MLPLFLAARNFIQRKRGAPAAAYIILLFSFAAISSLRPLTYVASQITADAPAISLMSLSALVLYVRFDRPTFLTAALSSLLLILSIGCKQNMVIAGLVLIIGTCWLFPRPFAWLYVGLLAAASVLVVAATALIYGGLTSIYYNDVIIPRAWPIDRHLIPGGASILLEACAPIALTLIGMVLMARIAGIDGHHSDRSRQFISIFFLLALVLAPVGLMTYCAWGGDANSFSHAVYFLLLGTVLASFELLSSHRYSRFTANLRAWFAWASLALLATGTTVPYRHSIADLFRRPPAAVQAHEYCSRNAGTVYFPANSIAAYLADHTFYHTYWGVMIRAETHQPLSRVEVLRYIPSRAQYVAVPRVYDPAYEPLLTFLAPHRITTSITGLADFEVFAIERSI